MDIYTGKNIGINIMEPIDVIILFIVLMVIISIGAGGYYLFLYKQEGEECTLDEEDEKYDEFGKYKYNDKKECVLDSCKTGYKLVGDNCVLDSCKTGYKLVGDKCVEQANPLFANGPTIEAQLRDPSPDITRDGDVNRPVVDQNEDCIIHSLGYNNHYKDGELTKKIYLAFTTNKYDNCSDDYKDKLFKKSSEIEPYLNSIGWKIDKNIDVEKFDYSKQSAISYIDYDGKYVRCDARSPTNDNSCVTYGDENSPPSQGQKYTDYSVNVRNIEMCEKRCSDKNDCVAYSFHQKYNHCALAGVDYERGNFGAVYMVPKTSEADQSWITKIKKIYGVPLHNKASS